MFESFFKVERRVLHFSTIKKMKFAIQMGKILRAFALTLPTFSGENSECILCNTLVIEDQTNHLTVTTKKGDSQCRSSQDDREVTFVQI